jgi:hypothetical protein
MALISVAQQNFQKLKNFFVFVVGEQQTVNRENSFFIFFIFGYLKYPLVTETGANRVPDNELIKSKGKKKNEKNEERNVSQPNRNVSSRREREFRECNGMRQDGTHIFIFSIFTVQVVWSN